MVTHRKTNDPLHSLYSGSITVYRCPKCGREEANPVFLRCPADDTMMKRHDSIDSKVVDEIRNRVAVGPEPESKGMTREQLWDEGLVESPIIHSLAPLTGRGQFRVKAKWSKTSFLERVIELTNNQTGDTWIISLADLGAALEGVL